jgi:hypothetical protein
MSAPLSVCGPLAGNGNSNDDVSPNLGRDLDEIGEAEALEHLAAVSLLARWADTATVDPGIARSL